MRCYTFVYTRRSSADDDRQVLSLDAQDRECRQFIERENYHLDELVRESHSARRPGRPLFNAMVAKIEKLLSSGNAVRVVCHKTDRLLRNLSDWARINDLVDAGLILDFVTGSFPNNAQGKMAFGIMALSAKYYVDNLSEEVKKGIAEKLERGEWPGWAPLGYRNQDQKIVVDLEVAPVIKRAFEYYASGEFSLAALSGKLYDEGLVGRRRAHPLTKAVLTDHILTNPFYCGLLRYRGELHPGSHTPIISVELFERVQTILHKVSRKRRISRSFRFAGLMHCEVCQCAVVGDIKKGRYVYYRCSHRRGPCPERYIREEALREQLATSVGDRLHLPPAAATALRLAADGLHREAVRGSENRPAILARRVRELEARQAALLDLRLSGHLTDPQYLSKRDELTMEQARANEQLAAFELPAVGPREAIEWFVTRCERVAAVVREGSDDEAREMLRIVGSNYRLGGGVVDFEPVKPFDMAAQVRNRSVWRAGADDVRTIAMIMSQIRTRGPREA